MASLTSSKPWQDLLKHHQEMSKTHLRQLFVDDPHRFDKFSISAGDLFLDFSKNHITDKTLQHLLQLAEFRKLQAHIEKMFKGEIVNHTENRPALHTALRNLQDELSVQGENISLHIKQNLESLENFSKKIWNQEWRGFTGEPITDVVNVGIGGSHLGPALAIEALSPYALSKLRFHFISNIDGMQLTETLNKLNLATTLFIISSKSFSTSETLTNAQTIQALYKKNDCTSEKLKQHFVAITANTEKAVAFGISRENIFSIPMWVGGRYSLWSAIGLPLILSVGMEQFKALLAGAFSLDQHFRTAPMQQNMPVILGLLNVWYCNFF